MVKFTIEAYHEADILLITSALQALAVQRKKRDDEERAQWDGEKQEIAAQQQEEPAAAESVPAGTPGTVQPNAVTAPKEPVARKASKSSKRDAQKKIQDAQKEKSADPTPPAAASTTEAAPTPAAAAAPSAGAPPTKSEVDRALRAYANKNGMQAARDLLAKFNIVRLPDLTEDKFASFLTAMMPAQASSDASSI